MEITYLFYGKLSKETESIQNCQDAYQVVKNCFSIADGASDGGPYPEIWADLLVDQFCENPNITKENWQDWLKPIQQKWLIEVKEKIKINRENNNPSWFYNNKKLTEKKLPAAAAFIGVQLKNNILHVTIVGDCCLFVWQENKFFQSVPYTKSSDFSSFPEYFASMEKNNKFAPQFIHWQILNKKDKYIILATDAFAKWIIENIEAKENVYKTLLNISSQEQFENIIATARKSKTIKLQNDDVALIVAKISKTKDLCSNDKSGTIKQNKPIEDAIPSQATVETEKQKKENLLKKFWKLVKGESDDNISDI